MYMFEGDYSSVIENTPDFDLKIGENATLTLAYLQKRTFQKLKCDPNRYVSIFNDLYA